VDVRDVLSGAARPEGRVLVHDELGFHQAPAAAELLAARGCTVEIVTPALVVAQDLGTTLDAELFHRRAHAAGIVLTTERLVTAVDGERVSVLHHPTGAGRSAGSTPWSARRPPSPTTPCGRCCATAPAPSTASATASPRAACRRPVVEGDRVGTAL
jgi:hypothetical protein